MDALQSVGEVTCTLGEIKNRADLIVVWRADPLESHPRLFSRYALSRPGASSRRAERPLSASIVDVRETETVREAADQFIAIRAGGEFEALWILRALATGSPSMRRTSSPQTGRPLETWRGLMDRMKAARYGVCLLRHGRREPGRLARWLTASMR